MRWQVVNSMCTSWDLDKKTCLTWNDAKIKKMFLYGDPNVTSTPTPWFSLTNPDIAVDVKGTNWRGKDDMRVIMTVSNYQWMHFTPFFASRYFGKPVTVSLPAEDLNDGY